MILLICKSARRKQGVFAIFAYLLRFRQRSSTSENGLVYLFGANAGELAEPRDSSQRLVAMYVTYSKWQVYLFPQMCKGWLHAKKLLKDRYCKRMNIIRRIARCRSTTAVRSSDHCHAVSANNRPHIPWRPHTMKWPKDDVFTKYLRRDNTTLILDPF